MPPRLKRLVTGEMRDTFGPGGFDQVEQPWSPPAVISDDDRAQARQALAPYDAALAPAPVDWISGRAATLLSHYFVASQPQALGAAAFGDWIDILGDLPAAAVQQACLKWLRTEPRRRPGPGDIRELALREVGDALKTQKRLRKLLELPSPGAKVVGIDMAASFPSRRR